MIKKPPMHAHIDHNLDREKYDIGFQKKFWEGYLENTKGIKVNEGIKLNFRREINNYKAFYPDGMNQLKPYSIQFHLKRQHFK